MKKLLLLLASIIGFLSVRAQTPVQVDQGALVAYVNSDRTQILSVRPGQSPKVILQSKGVGTLQEIRTSHLAVLASTRRGKSLLIAGVFHFFNLNDDSKDSIQGFIRLDSPFALTGRVSLDRKTIGGHKVLYEIPSELEKPGFIDIRKVLPLGELSPNEQDWYGHMAKNGAAPNSFEFYHGKFDGSGTVDIGTLPDGDERLPTNEYHMTNICTDGQMMICVVMDRLTLEDDLLRCRLWRWTPGQTPQLTDMNEIRALRPNWHMDSSFVCLLRIIPGTDQAEIGLVPNDEGNIIFYNFRYTGGSINFGSPNGRQIPRSVLPDSIFFFTGKTENPQGPNDGGKETVSTSMRHVNGGDMMFSPTGDSVVFIVSNALTPLNAADWYASPERSGIWLYDIAAQWDTAKFIYNDKTKMERQPIFMGFWHKFVTPPPPGTITVDKTSLNFGELFVGNDKPNADTLDVKITNPGVNEASVSSISISGPQELDFMVTGTTPAMTTPFSLTKDQSVTVHVAFNPSAIGTRNATLTITFADGDSSRTVSLTGSGKKDTTGSGVVDPKDLAAFSVNVHPNPTSGNAKIDIQFDGREGLAVRLVDVLGREYTPIGFDGMRTLALTENAWEQFTIDRSKMNLVPGSYTLFVKNGDRTITRQIVVTE